MVESLRLTPRRVALCSDNSLEGYEELSGDIPKFRNQEQGSRVGWVELVSPRSIGQQKGRAALGGGRFRVRPAWRLFRLYYRGGPENIPQMSDFFLPQMGEVLKEGVILALIADASGPGCGRGA
jgi:hypothetical protein